jgi:lysophospholipase L1-like esterase
LSSKDFIILCCGTNDIGRVNSRAVFSDIIGFIKRVNHTNVILLTVLYRHDLRGSNTIINEKIINFNRKLHKLTKLFLHLSVLEIDANRHLYTKHGLHLNGLGKEFLFINLALQILSLLKKEIN